jgi:uncharacterized repeat protein (TIGR03803 family)
MKRVVNAVSELKRGKRAGAVFALCGVMPIALTAQTFTTLHSFDFTDGESPNGTLVQATNGDLYGTTFFGGPIRANVVGTVFKISTGGTLTTEHVFCPQTECTDGANPEAGLVQAINGDFYGTTEDGGANDHGTVFKIGPSGALTTLYNFCSQGGCADGETPIAGLVQATNGDFYGTTSTGGANGYGTVFKITPSGTLTTVYSFCSQSGCMDGATPQGGLFQAMNGDLYGTTSCGGAGVGLTTCGSTNLNIGGTVFKMTPAGALTTLYSFCSRTGCMDGANPRASLIQATNGDLYGTTSCGGAGTGLATCGSSMPDTGGTIFKITPTGTLTTLYSFCSQSACTDGALPAPALVQATNGDLYGTTVAGGADGFGTVFKITPTGALTTLHGFDGTDGENPIAGLALDTNGILYGTTSGGGANGDGTVFGLSVGLGPFVETRPAAGEAGSFVEILGSNLTGATSVTFKGTAATFTVVSRYLITTSVPSGASTGKVEVVTPSTTLSSNVSFVVP